MFAAQALDQFLRLRGAAGLGQRIGAPVQGGIGAGAAVQTALEFGEALIGLAPVALADGLVTLLVQRLGLRGICRVRRRRRGADREAQRQRERQCTGNQKTRWGFHDDIPRIGCRSNQTRFESGAGVAARLQALLDHAHLEQQIGIAYQFAQALLL
ncbi:hypothetical protein [Lysobacter gummosus]|uniref:hypothetical protein n=1 Tax=Lysobacter gummosus TaxID=262324 RepID=UPI003638E625